MFVASTTSPTTSCLTVEPGAPLRVAGEVTPQKRSVTIDAYQLQGAHRRLVASKQVIDRSGWAVHDHVDYAQAGSVSADRSHQSRRPQRGRVLARGAGHRLSYSADDEREEIAGPRGEELPRDSLLAGDNRHRRERPLAAPMPV
jgi:hypothetical protein